MKKISSYLILGALLIVGQAGYADDDFRPALVPKTPERIFTPHGFDSNDNVQVVIDDELTSTCYKAGPIKVSVDPQEKTIMIENHNYYYPGAWCAEVMTPYYRAIDLGILGAGTYRVVTEDNDGKVVAKGSMRVQLSNTLAPDDYLYAPVSEVSVKQPENGGYPQLTLRGTFSNTCMTLKEVRPTYSPENVIEVLPIAALESTNCKPASIPFTKTVPLTNVPKGRTLVHVRSLNGQAINQVYSF